MYVCMCVCRGRNCDTVGYLKKLRSQTLPVKK